PEILGGRAGVLSAADGVNALRYDHRRSLLARRTNELGVRAALGATPWAMTWLVLRQVAWISLPGIAIGTGGAILVTGVARNLLFDLTPTEPRLFLVAALVLAMAAALARWIPPRRAA